ncbi:DUF350 domain-containing protein [Dactylosporangium sp. AC04546]|uniref:DUF350 domain-containing protein n=1 Tax=Dactylosporangium sp. AC04546 TaxID=2862460 RepID=UPI001EDD3664|nr:DUF350 domain-containing protein [Dactylosporangium sp. AC04546]WVK87814.1 DUF350 domain-containing protein [Dactylosporangium sp. AC04546]
MLELVTDLAITLGYAAIGIVLMAIGAVLVDVATPGSLRQLIWTDRNANAAILLASNLVAVGAITVTAIVASDGDFVKGIASTVGYGLVGLLVMTVAFIVVDMATPGKLGALLVHPESHPAVWITAAVHLAVGAIIAAAIL